MDPVYYVGALRLSQKQYDTPKLAHVRLKEEDRFYQDMAETPWLFKVVKSACAVVKGVWTFFVAYQRKGKASKMVFHHRSKALR